MATGQALRREIVPHGELPALEGPPASGRTDHRCTWVYLVPRPCCTTEGVSGHLPTGRAYQREQTSSSGRQCPLVTTTNPGHRDHSAAVVVVTQVSLPGRPSTRSCHIEESLPSHACPPPATCHVHLVARPGFQSPPAASRSPFGVEHTGAAAGPAASSWQSGVYWRFCGSVGPFSLSTAFHSPGHHDSVPAGARNAALPLSHLRGLPSPHISFAPTVHVAVPHVVKTRGAANEASLPVRHL
ncbi:hypothetical protein MRX96_032369 [Rhipicephalus microplus]